MSFRQTNPCILCGACCAFYRASFHWTEADDAGGTVPVALTEDGDSFRRAMKGTGQHPPRCVALDGEIGVRVACSIYQQRSSTCREFSFSWQEGEHNDKCDRARMAWGFPPLPAPSSSSLLAPRATDELATPQLPLGAETCPSAPPADGKKSDGDPF